MVPIPEIGDSQIDQIGAVLLLFGLGVFHRPAGIAVLLAELGWHVFPIFGDTA